jgi:hypothetical protein
VDPREALKSILYGWGKRLARPAGQVRPKGFSRQLAFNAFALAALVGLFLFSFAGPVSDYVASLYRENPALLMGKSEYKVLYTENCGEGCAKLWQSGASLADSDFYSQARQLAGKKFWVGAEIGAAALGHAKSRQAHTYVLGRINAEYSIFLNGSLIQRGDGKDILPAMISLSEAELSGKTLRIAIQVNHNLNSVYPVAFNEPSAESGFYSSADARSFQDRKILLVIIRPVALAVAAFFSALTFFALWLNVRERNEFFLFGLFALCLASIQIMSWNHIAARIPRDSYYSILLFFRVAEGMSVGFLGLAYARSRLGAYITVAAAGLFCLGISLLPAELKSDLYFSGLLAANTFVPFAFLLGALACLSQAELGRREGFSMPKAKEAARISRLRQFAFLLALLGGLYFIDTHKLFHLGSAAYWDRPIQFALVCLIGAFLLRDFRQFDILQEKTHISRFHQPGAENVVKGILLEIDMKNSSRLYDLSAQEGHAKELPSIWNEAAVQVAAAAGGEILATEGDAFRAFFEEPFEVERILRLLAEIEALSAGMPFPVEFRATLVKGGIKPVYKELNGKLFEDYDHAPGETCFKDASRFLREEKRMGFSGSVIVAESSLLASVPAGIELLKTEQLSVADVGQRELSFFRISRRLKAVA